MPWGPAPTEGSHAQAEPVCDGTQELTLWEVTAFLEIAVPGQARGHQGSSASLATATVNSWRKMQKYLLALGIALAARCSQLRGFLTSLWFPSFEQPFANLRNLSLNSG